MTFKHLFLKDYVDGGMDTYAVYRQADVYDHIDYIIGQVTESYNFLFISSFFLKGTPRRLCVFARISWCECILIMWQ